MLYAELDIETEEPLEVQDADGMVTGAVEDSFVAGYHACRERTEELVDPGGGSRVRPLIRTVPHQQETGRDEKKKTSGTFGLPVCQVPIPNL